MSGVDWRADVGKSFVLAENVSRCPFCGAPFVQFLSGAYGEPMAVSLRHPTAGPCALVNHTFPLNDEMVALLNKRANTKAEGLAAPAVRRPQAEATPNPEEKP